MSLQKIALSVLSLAAVACIGLAPARAADPSPAAMPALTKDQVEQIIHDYIMDNPKLIMESVDTYQRKSMQAREASADADVKKNKDALTRDSSSPEAGDPAGDVTVVEFFDYNCHFCKGAFPAVQTLLEKDKKLRIVFKEFPILGPSSETAAKWALAAQKQKKYFAFHAAMMNNKEPISDSLLEKVAKSVGMDVDKAKMDLSSPDILVQLEKNRTLANELDISGTPAFVIGDDISRGAIPEDAMEQKISDLRAAGKK
jgi:protein-disulfide isomerase